MFHHQTEVWVSILWILLLTGCGSQMNSSIAQQSVNIAVHCDTTAELQQFYAVHSLGERVEIQTRGQLVFVQTFPYSGIRASHLFAYAKQNEGLAFLCFFRVETQSVVDLGEKDDGLVEIRAENATVGILSRPKANSLEGVL